MAMFAFRQQYSEIGFRRGGTAMRIFLALEPLDSPLGCALQLLWRLQRAAWKAENIPRRRTVEMF